MTVKVGYFNRNAQRYDQHFDIRLMSRLDHQYELLWGCWAYDNFLNPQDFAPARE